VYNIVCSSFSHRVEIRPAGCLETKKLYETAITRGGKLTQKYLTTELEVFRQTIDVPKIMSACGGRVNR